VRTLVVGDVHGCAAELRALVEEAGADRLILVGDLFAKGPDPLGVWRIIDAMKAEAVLGNHDAYMLDGWTRALRGEGRSPQDEAVRLLGDAEADVRAWLSKLPLFLFVGSALVVHAGIHPTLGVGGTRRDRAVNMRRFPAEEQTFWWERYKGGHLVLYGHDAMRGLQDRRPYTLGLDTGCVYGGRLTGFLIEDDTLVSVPAEQVWSPV
jgi:hypothetical protein